MKITDDPTSVLTVVTVMYDMADGNVVVDCGDASILTALVSLKAAYQHVELMCIPVKVTVRAEGTEAEFGYDCD